MSRVEVPKYPRCANNDDAASRIRPRVDAQSTTAGRQPCPYFTSRFCHRPVGAPDTVGSEVEAELRWDGGTEGLVERGERLRGATADAVGRRQGGGAVHAQIQAAEHV